jgi:hypothetical protein
MSDDLVVPIRPSEVFRPSRGSPVRGGHTRVVPAVPVGDDGSTAPCIWRSPRQVQMTAADGSKTPACECLLLLSRDPPTVMRAEVALDAWQHFGECLVEW